MGDCKLSFLFNRFSILQPHSCIAYLINSTVPAVGWHDISSVYLVTNIHLQHCTTIQSVTSSDTYMIRGSSGITFDGPDPLRINHAQTQMDVTNDSAYIMMFLLSYM